jgi:phosphoglycolate phosphatase-like HAD superfamily hydrolase
LIGDSDSDRKAAEAAGMAFVFVENHLDFAGQMNKVIDGILDAD